MPGTPALPNDRGGLFDKRETLRSRARERFGDRRAEELDEVLCQVAADLELIEKFTPDPDDGP